MFNNSSDGTVGEKKIKVSDTGGNIRTDGGKWRQNQCLTTVAMEQLEGKNQSI